MNPYEFYCKSHGSPKDCILRQSSLKPIYSGKGNPSNISISFHLFPVSYIVLWQFRQYRLGKGLQTLFLNVHECTGSENGDCYFTEKKLIRNN